MVNGTVATERVGSYQMSNLNNMYTLSDLLTCEACNHQLMKDDVNDEDKKWLKENEDTSYVCYVCRLIEEGYKTA